MSIFALGASPIATNVPCNGCTLCCRGYQAIILHPECGDDAAKYQTVEVPNPLTGEPALMVEQKPNGDCIYLGEQGCSIYEDRPIICRGYDCRKHYMTLTKAVRQALVEKGMASKDTFAAGKQRIGSLTSTERLDCIAKRNSRFA
jgi:Fe-S-cluster containining protein